MIQLSNIEKKFQKIPNKKNSVCNGLNLKSNPLNPPSPQQKTQ